MGKINNHYNLYIKTLLIEYYVYKCWRKKKQKNSSNNKIPLFICYISIKNTTVEKSEQLMSRFYLHYQ